MTGWIIYDSAGALRNEWFIHSFISTADRYGIELTLKVTQNDDILDISSPPDFVIVRTIDPLINKFFEAHGIPVFNNYRTSKIANNKWLTYELCGKLKIPAMRTHLLSSFSSLPDSFDYPIVIKSLDGHGGQEVFLIKNDCELSEKLAVIDKNNYLMQEFCSDPGRDMRVYVLGDVIISAVERTSYTDFRSNFSLGGSVSVCDVTREQESIIKKIKDELMFDLAGVDFIYHNGRWVLNEIEDVVGTRMLYKCTDVDIIDLYMRYIVNHLSVNSKM